MSTTTKLAGQQLIYLFNNLLLLPFNSNVYLAATKPASISRQDGWSEPGIFYSNGA
jgi:hypothetical protein